MIPMDSGEMPCSGGSKKGFRYLFMRLILTLFLPILTFFFLSFLVGIIAILFGELSVSSSVFVPSQCKIVSSSVDIRSSKVCELGLLNYKAKRVFYPFEGSKFRCRYDYYWASVFKVEYVDQSLGQTRLALAEAPNEALPLNCRPNFGTAWLTKDKFKVNETYDCWYTLGISKVSLYRDGFFSCQAKDPSTVEMIRRYFILSMKMLQSWFASKRKSKYWKWETVVGVTTGFLTSLITISIARILQQMKSWILARVFNIIRIKRACFLVVYLSVMGWLAIQYGKKLGLLKIFHNL
ncbi:Exopolysaccharide production negative regulator [Melia azedarach]|uniref:Exopolysaccharide production negative regulator n=1 Tax=Melia azedarach TaxID=155640 RepID=A0ACC1YZE6_MELAZ|nr:Exopolysaccharide production negative regulator [Melia azedarach]